MGTTESTRWLKEGRHEDAGIKGERVWAWWWVTRDIREKGGNHSFFPSFNLNGGKKMAQKETCV